MEHGPTTCENQSALVNHQVAETQEPQVIPDRAPVYLASIIDEWVSVSVLYIESGYTWVGVSVVNRRGDVPNIPVLFAIKKAYSVVDRQCTTRASPFRWWEKNLKAAFCTALGKLLYFIWRSWYSETGLPRRHSVLQCGIIQFNARSALKFNFTKFWTDSNSSWPLISGEMSSAVSMIQAWSGQIALSRSAY